jgi:predicted nucleic acid-binding protein
MPEEQRRIYWDSCVFLEYIDRNSPHLNVLDVIVESAKRGDILLITSMIAITEVAIAPRVRSGKPLRADIAVQIDNLWIDDSMIRLIDFHELIARDARELVRWAREQEWHLAAADAIHLASAQRNRVAEIHTYDDKWQKYADRVGCRIVEPYARQPQLL